MSRISSHQRLNAKWAHELYTVSEETIQVDRRRRCWICGGPFKLGDGMTVCGTEEGNKLMHSRCYQAQRGCL